MLELEAGIKKDGLKLSKLICIHFSDQSFLWKFFEALKHEES